jgi:small subunit ribosomal protein S19
MSRSGWKGNYVSKSILKKAVKKVWSRNSTIPYYYLNKKVSIHTGKEFRSLFITEDKIGFKFGEFAYTRKKKQRNLSVKKNKK